MSDKPFIITFAAQKGGVGKSFLSVNVAGFLVSLGYKVLVAETDQQENISDSYLLDDSTFNQESHRSLNGALLGEYPLLSAVYTATYADITWRMSKSGEFTREVDYQSASFLDFIPAGYGLSAISAENIDALKERLIELPYDIIIVDTPPAETDIAMMAYASADLIITPFTDLSSFKSVRMMVDTVEELNTGKVESEKTLYRVVINRYAGRKVLDRELEKAIAETFGEYLFKTRIRESAAAGNSQAEGLPLSHYRKTDLGKDLYLLTKEIEAIKP